jgi:hypothetical protein
MIDRRVKLLLKALANGRWHNHFPQQAITPRVIEGCLALKLVKRKLVPVKGKRHHFWGYFKITGKGRRSLKEGEHPTREQINYVIKYYYVIK